MRSAQWVKWEFNLMISLIISFSCIFVFLIFKYSGILIDNPPKIKEACKDIPADNSPIDSGLVLHYHFDGESGYAENKGSVCDFSGNKNDGLVNGAVWNPTGGIRGSGAFEFGPGEKILVPDSDSLSPSISGENFTVTFFAKFRNTAFSFPSSSYINYIGKGSRTGGYEWLFRQYNSSNDEGRENRLSFYAFNLSGGLGAGGYFQEDIDPEEWIFVVGVMNSTHISIYKDGIIRSSNLLSDYDIRMGNGKSDLFIGAEDGEKSFGGSIDELRIYGRALDESEIESIYLNS